MIHLDQRTPTGTDMFPTQTKNVLAISASRTLRNLEYINPQIFERLARPSGLVSKTSLSAHSFVLWDQRLASSDAFWGGRVRRIDNPIFREQLTHLGLLCEDTEIARLVIERAIQRVEASKNPSTWEATNLFLGQQIFLVEHSIGECLLDEKTLFRACMRLMESKTPAEVLISRKGYLNFSLISSMVKQPALLPFRNDVSLRDQLSKSRDPKAIVTALLMPLKQEKEGNCFALALGVYLRKHRPRNVLTDFQQLQEKGYLSRTVKDKVVNFPSIHPEDILKSWVCCLASMAEAKPNSPYTESIIRSVLEVLVLLDPSFVLGKANFYQTLKQQFQTNFSSLSQVVYDDGFKLYSSKEGSLKKISNMTDFKSLIKDCLKGTPFQELIGKPRFETVLKRSYSLYWESDKEMEPWVYEGGQNLGNIWEVYMSKVSCNTHVIAPKDAGELFLFLKSHASEDLPVAIDGLHTMNLLPLRDITLESIKKQLTHIASTNWLFNGNALDFAVYFNVETKSFELGLVGSEGNPFIALDQKKWVSKQLWVAFDLA